MTALARLRPENRPILIAAGFILVILALGTAYTLSSQGTAPLLSPNYLLQQLQIGAFLGIVAAGMMMGSMMSRMFMPGYTPMYRQPYTTSPAARGALASQRNSFRAANPSRFPPKASGSGRSYGGKGGAFGGAGSGRTGGGGGGRSGGGRFGVARPAGRKVVHLA